MEVGLGKPGGRWECEGLKSSSCSPGLSHAMTLPSITSEAGCSKPTCTCCCLCYHTFSSLKQHTFTTSEVSRARSLGAGRLPRVSQSRCRLGYLSSWASSKVTRLLAAFSSCGPRAEVPVFQPAASGWLLSAPEAAHSPCHWPSPRPPQCRAGHIFKASRRLSLTSGRASVPLLRAFT